jgi:hypothetical protein
VTDITFASPVRFTEPITPVRVEDSNAGYPTIRSQGDAPSDFSIAMMTLRGPSSSNSRASDT